MTASIKGFTAGPCSAVHNGSYWEIRNKNHGKIGDTCASKFIYVDGKKMRECEADEIAKANAHLIAEAFTVAHETGLTPRQLAERCEKLEAALRYIARTWPDSSAAKHARATIAKAKGGAS